MDAKRTNRPRRGPRTQGILTPDEKAKENAEKREIEPQKRELPTGGGAEFPGQSRANPELQPGDKPVVLAADAGSSNGAESKDEGVRADRSIHEEQLWEWSCAAAESEAGAAADAGVDGGTGDAVGAGSLLGGGSAAGECAAPGVAERSDDVCAGGCEAQSAVLFQHPAAFADDAERRELWWGCVERDH